MERQKKFTPTNGRRRKFEKADKDEIKEIQRDAQENEEMEYCWTNAIWKLRTTMAMAIRMMMINAQFLLRSVF